MSADLEPSAAPAEEFEQVCARCGGYFEAAEEVDLCPDCEMTS